MYTKSPSYFALYAFIMLLISYSVKAQVGVNNTSPQSMLDITASSVATPANSDGILIPRIDAFPAIDPTASQDGMLVFVTGAGTPEEGFYYWDNGTTSWIPFVRRIDDLEDGKSDNDGTNNGSSVYLGIEAGEKDDSSHNRNVGIGYRALEETVGAGTDGDDNVAVGYEAFTDNTLGEKGVALGYGALKNNTEGDFNVGVGYNAMETNTTGRKNTGLGYRSLMDNLDGDDNVAVGYQTLFWNADNDRNTGVGNYALYSNDLGNRNVAVGYNAMKSNDGEQNVAIGYNSFQTNAFDAPDDDALPDDTYATITSYDNSIAIGYETTMDASNKVVIGNTATTYIGGQVAWTTISDGRFKTNINEDVNGLDFIMALRPVTYNLDLNALDKFQNNSNVPHDGEAEALVRTGFIAQEVEQAANKVGYDFDGVVTPKNKSQHYSVQYATFVVPLTKAVQQQQEIINDQKEKIKSLEMRLSK